MNNPIYCDFNTVEKGYAKIHGPVSLLVCFFGSVANILNICVLTSKEMRSPTNLILTGLAVADLLVMLDYIPYVFHNIHTDTHYVSNFSYEWAVFAKFHAIFSQVFHFTSCCFTVILAIWRYLAITNPNSGKFWCEWRKTLYILIITFFICVLICCPLLMSYEIAPLRQICDEKGRILLDEDLTNYTGRIHTETIYLTDYVERYKTLCFWIYSVIIKLVPCILLTDLSIRIVTVLCEMKKRRRLLLTSNVHLQNLQEGKPIISKKLNKHKQADRTSMMLLAVLLLFLLTEFPQAILGLLSATMEKEFESQCYRPLGDVMDILALTNSAINFILYCTMSRQFRETFQEVFRLKYLQKFNPLSQHSANLEKTFTSSV